MVGTKFIWLFYLINGSFGNYVPYDNIYSDGIIPYELPMDSGGVYPGYDVEGYTYDEISENARRHNQQPEFLLHDEEQTRQPPLQLPQQPMQPTTTIAPIPERPPLVLPPPAYPTTTTTQIPQQPQTTTTATTPRPDHPPWWQSTPYPTTTTTNIPQQSQTSTTTTTQSPLKPIDQPHPTTHKPRPPHGTTTQKPYGGIFSILGSVFGNKRPWFEIKGNSWANLPGNMRYEKNSTSSLRPHRMRMNGIRDIGLHDPETDFQSLPLFQLIPYNSRYSYDSPPVSYHAQYPYNSPSGSYRSRPIGYRYPYDSRPVLFKSRYPYESRPVPYRSRYSYDSHSLNEDYSPMDPYLMSQQQRIEQYV